MQPGNLKKAIVRFCAGNANGRGHYDYDIVHVKLIGGLQNDSCHEVKHCAICNCDYIDRSSVDKKITGFYSLEN